MGSDMIVALKEASANGNTLFGLNHHATPATRHSLQIFAAQHHELGENVPGLVVPQARQTNAVLGLQAEGQWGFLHGINDCRVAAGVTSWQSRLPADATGLDGPALLRLALERGKTAHLAAEVITDLLGRHGQKGDHIFLLADSNESFVLETSGRYWALLECGHTRVVTDTAMIRQDWRRLSPGLADTVIEKGWWQDDGSKIDFVRCVGENTQAAKNAQKRWGRASLAIAQQLRAIDGHFLRHMLAEHYVTNRDMLPREKEVTLATSFLAELKHNEMPILAWVAFGTPRTSLYFPICLAGELPAAFGAGTGASIQERSKEMLQLTQTRERDRLTIALERLQTKFDQDAEDFETRAVDYQQHGKPHLVASIATEMMHQHVELFEKEYRRLFGVEEKFAPKAPVAEEMLFYA